jgi:hypothetical protein
VNEHSPICSNAKFEWDVANGHQYLNREFLGLLGKLVFRQKSSLNTRNLAAVGAMLLQVASKENVLALAAWGLDPLQPVMFTFGRCYLELHALLRADCDNPQHQEQQGRRVRADHGFPACQHRHRGRVRGAWPH